jgi:hypothetical protein
MNELQIIRNQLSIERQHAVEVANACASVLQKQPTLEDFREAAVEYLAWVLARFEERDQTLMDLVRARHAIPDQARTALEEMISRPGKSREALAKLELALSAGATRDATLSAGATPHAMQSAIATPDATRWREFGQFFDGVWRARRDAIDGFLEQNPRVADWRTISAIDADSILEERRRYARVRECLPAGVELRAHAS